MKSLSVQPSHDDPASGYGSEQLSTVLMRIAAELDEVAQRIDANQAIIAAAGQATPLDSCRITAMQDADLCAQRVAGVAGFIRSLALVSPAQWDIDTMPASQALTLAAQVMAIGHPSAGTTLGVGDQQSGDFDLF